MSTTTRSTRATLSAEALAAAEAARRREARRRAAERRRREAERRRRRVQNALTRAARVEAAARTRLAEIEAGASLWAGGALGDAARRPLADMTARIEIAAQRRAELAGQAGDGDGNGTVTPDDAEAALADVETLASETETLAFTLRATGRERAATTETREEGRNARAGAPGRAAARGRAGAPRAVPGGDRPVSATGDRQRSETSPESDPRTPDSGRRHRIEARAAAPTRAAANDDRALQASRAGLADRAALVADLRTALDAAVELASVSAGAATTPDPGAARAAVERLERFLAGRDAAAVDRAVDEARHVVSGYVTDVHRARFEGRRRVDEIGAGVEQLVEEVRALTVECDQLGHRPPGLPPLIGAAEELRQAFDRADLAEVARLRDLVRDGYAEVDGALDRWIDDRARGDVVIDRLAAVLRDVGLRVDPRVHDVPTADGGGARVLVARQRDDTELRFSVVPDGEGGHEVACDGEGLPDEAGRAPEEIAACADLDATLARVGERLGAGDVQLGPWQSAGHRAAGAGRRIPGAVSRITSTVRQTIDGRRV